MVKILNYIFLNFVSNFSSNPPDTHEMHEFIRRTSSEDNLNTIYRSDSNASDYTIINPPQEHQVK